MNQTVYVITINYNSAIHTIEMVKSVMQSDYINIKIIIVDNNSEEEDYKKLYEISNKATIIRSKVNLGFSGGNNIGIRAAINENAKYIMIINNDTIIKKDTISEMINALNNKKADVICPKILNYYNHNVINYAGGELVNYKGGVKIYGLGKNDKESLNKEKIVTFAHGCCILTTTDIWKKVDFMDEKYFLYFEDVALSAKFKKFNKSIMYFPKAVVYHKESTSTNKFSDNYQYYFCRNRLLYISENIKLPVRLISYIYTGAFMIKHILKKEYSVYNVYCAIRAFINKEFGIRRV